MLSLGISITSVALFGGAGEFTTPASLSGLQLWFDADDAATISIATGVAQWDDKSGNNNHASKAVGAQQPTVAAASLNGKNTIAFASAATQFLDLTTPITAVTATDEWTVFFIYKRAIANALVTPLGSADSASNPNYPTLVYTDNRMFSTSSAKRALSTETYPDAASYHTVETIHHSGDTWDLLVDDVAATMSPGVLASAANWSKVGAALGASDFYTNGNVAEIIYYNRVLASGERASVNAYLLAKWGI